MNKITLGGNMKTPLTRNDILEIKNYRGAARTKLYRGIQRGIYTVLAPGIVTPTKTFEPLPHWEQHKLRALAVGANRTRIIAGISAANQWGMWTNITPRQPVEFYTQKDIPARQFNYGQRLRGYLPHSHICIGQHISATTIPRTIIDVARYHSYETCFMAATWAIRNQACTKTDIRNSLTPSLKIDTTIEDILEKIDPIVESPPEAYLFAQSHKYGHFTLVPQEPAVDRMHTIRRADFRIRNTRYLVEISGTSKFGRTHKEQTLNFQQEIERHYALTNNGYHILSYTAADVFSGRAYNDIVFRLQEPEF